MTGATVIRERCVCYYDPGTGRFLSQDPIGFRSHDYNIYRYVFNSPINDNDPTGNGPIMYEMCLIGNNLSAQTHLSKIRIERDETLKELDNQIEMLKKIFKDASKCQESEKSLDAEIKEIERLKKMVKIRHATAYGASVILFGGAATACNALLALPTP